VIALSLPEVLGDGSALPAIDGTRHPIQAMLDVRVGVGWTAAAFLLLLLVAKVVATSVSSGAGMPVGELAPTLFAGAALGGALGIAAANLLGSEVDPGAFALVGMAAVFSATTRAPLTGILIVFELTRSYELVLPLMVAVGIATLVAELRGSDSIYLHQLRQRGVVFGQPDDLDVLQLVTVGEVMRTDHPVIDAALPRDQVRTAIDASETHGLAVVEPDGRLVGVVTLHDLEREGATAGELATRRVVTATPDDPVFRAVRRMATLDVGRVPVVDPTTRRVVGMLRRADIVRAYQRGIDRSMGVQQRRAAGQLRDLTGVGFVELVVDATSPLVGTAVRDVAWPERTVLTSVQRSGEVLVPTGDTVMHAGDNLIVLTGDAPALRRVVSGVEDSAR